MVQDKFAAALQSISIDPSNLWIRMIRNFLFALTCLTSFMAEASLRMYPTRIFMTPASKSASVTVRNEHPKSAKFRAELKFYEMNDSGKMTEVQSETPEQTEIRKMVKFSPREFTLNANQEQLIRILSKLPPSTAPAEYRVHLHVSTFEDGDAKLIAKDSDANAQVSTELKVHFGVAVPLIMRTGEISQIIKLDAKPMKSQNDGKSLVNLTISNTGLGSVFGAVKIYSNDSKTQMLAELNGIAIYGKQRTFEIPLDQPTSGHAFIEFQNDLDQNISHARY
jgi:fimbrial chaperone protein